VTRRESHPGRVVEPGSAPDTAEARVSPARPVTRGGAGSTPPRSIRPHHSQGGHHSKAVPRSTSQQRGVPQRMPWSQPRHVPEPPLGLNEAIWRRMCRNPRAVRLVQPVWSRLAELELAGHDPGALAALRYALMLHQPTRRGTCRACRWRARVWGWWRPRWPCVTWIQVRAELLGCGIASSETLRHPHSGPDKGPADRQNTAVYRGTSQVPEANTGG